MPPLENLQPVTSDVLKKYFGDNVNANAPVKKNVLEIDEGVVPQNDFSQKVPTGYKEKQTTANTNIPFGNNTLKQVSGNALLLEKDKPEAPLPLDIPALPYITPTKASVKTKTETRTEEPPAKTNEPKNNLMRLIKDENSKEAKRREPNIFDFVEAAAKGWTHDTSPTALDKAEEKYQYDDSSYKRIMEMLYGQEAQKELARLQNQYALEQLKKRAQYEKGIGLYGGGAGASKDSVLTNFLLQ